MEKDTKVALIMGGILIVSVWLLSRIVEEEKQSVSLSYDCVILYPE